MNKMRSLVFFLILSFGAIVLNAGVVDGYMWDEYVIEAGEELDYEWTFTGGEAAEVYVEGDTSTDLDLFIYDLDGNLIVSDDGEGDTCEVEWTPAETTTYIVRLKNLGDFENYYYIESN